MAKKSSRSYTQDELSDEERFIGSIIKSAREDKARTREVFDSHLRLYRSQYHKTARSSFAGDLLPEDGTELGYSDIVESNYLYGHVDSLVASIAPPNPKVTIKAHRESLKDAARAREALVNRVFQKEELASKLWKLCARAVVWPRCFLKTVWSPKKRRPVIRIVNPHRVWFDVVAEDWEDVRWVMQVTTVTKGQFKKRLRKKGKSIGSGEVYRHDAMEDADFGAMPDWLKSDTPDVADEHEDAINSSYKIAVVYEFYDLVGRRFYHFAEGCPKALCDEELPYKYLENPFTPLVFNDNLMNLAGMSDAELVAPTIGQKNEMTSLQMMYVNRAMPRTIINTSFVDDPEDFMDSFAASSSPDDIIELRGRMNAKIGDILSHTQSPHLNQDWHRMTAELEETIRATLGTTTYDRGGVGSGDVATEFALTDAAKKTREARRQKALYFAIASLGRNIINLFREYLDEGNTIPLSLPGDKGTVEVGPAELGFLLDAEEVPEGTDPAESERAEDDPWVWDYEALPYNASEANSIVALKRLEAFLPILQAFSQQGLVDSRLLAGKLLELLQMDELLMEEQEAAPAAPPPPMPGPGQVPGEGAVATMPGQPAGPPASPEALPGVSDVAAAPMIGGQVASGSGAQGLPQ